jgi:hypothetical protein
LVFLPLDFLDLLLGSLTCGDAWRLVSVWAVCLAVAVGGV